MSGQNGKSFLSGFGSGAIIIVAVALVYIFGYGEQPIASVTKSSLEVYVISSANEQTLMQLKDIIPDLTEQQKAGFENAAIAFSNQKDTAAQALSVVGQDVPYVSVKVVPSNAQALETILPLISENEGIIGNTK